MAEFHLHGQIIKRSEGRSSVACAAYRSGTKLFDERLGRSVSFAQKPGVIHSEILVPEGAPEWMRDRERLWNAAERAEHRRDAQLAHDFDIALPVELSATAQRELVRTFAFDQFVQNGWVADFSIHCEDEANPHFHLMVPMRTAGPHGFSREKPRQWGGRIERLQQLRAAWADAANDALAREGHVERVDHRSFAARGIDLEPQPKLFRRESEAPQDARDHVQARADALIQCMHRNGQRVLARPEVVVAALTSKRSTFNERDLVRFVHRHTATAEQFELALLRVKALPELLVVGREDDEAVYTTRAIVALEAALLADAHLLAHRPAHVVASPLVEQALELSQPRLTDEQAAAVGALAASSDLSIVTGYAGTGKSVMLSAARVAWQAQGYRVQGGTLAGRAADVLAASAQIPARTLHAWQYAWERNQDRLTSSDVFVVDEAAMVGSDLLATILYEVKRAGAKLVLVGDASQLRAVERGAPFRLLQERYEGAVLSSVLRQNAHPWQRAATTAFATGQPSTGLQAYVEHGRVRGVAGAHRAASGLVAEWASDRAQASGETALLLGFSRRDVRHLNDLVRAERERCGELGKHHNFETSRGTRGFAVGDRLMFLRNDRLLAVTNGLLGTVEQVEETRLAVRCDDGRYVELDTRRYDAIDHGYAATIHKAQGTTVDRTYVLASRYMDAAATYVALSRHRRDAMVFYDQDEFPSVESLVHTLSRPQRVSMAHDFLGDEEAKEIAARVERENRLLAIRPADEDAEVEVLQRIAARRMRSAAEVLNDLPEVREAGRRRAEAEQRFSAAAHAWQSSQRSSPYSWIRLADSWQRAEQRVFEEARRELERADAALLSVRAAPATRERAAWRAQVVNGQINRAHRRWRDLLEHRASRLQEEAIEKHARNLNRVAGSVGYRTVQAADAGRELALVSELRIGAVELLVLREHADAPLILADARRCTAISTRGPVLVKALRQSECAREGRDL